MKANRLTLLLAPALLLLALASPAKRVKAPSNTGKHNSYAVSKTAEQVQKVDTALVEEFANKYIILAGFDKTVESAYESLFLSNNSNDTLTSISLNIRYSMPDGRALTASDHTIDCTIPPHETRQISFPSWDKQKSFYYKNSRHPARRQATPFTVNIKVTGISLKNSNH